MSRGKHARKKELNLAVPVRKLGTGLTLGVILSGMMIPSSAFAQDGSSVDNVKVTGDGYVAVTRSFPVQSTPRTDYFSETNDDNAQTVSTDNDGSWSLGSDEYAIGDGIEQTTKQQDEAKAKKERERKEAEAKKKAEAERKRAEAERKHAEEKAAQERLAAQSQQESYTNDSNVQSNTHVDTHHESQDVPSAPSSPKGTAIADAAKSLVGGSMDCTMLVTLALQKATGIYFHGWPEDYKYFPGAVETSWADAQAGDILVYRDGSSYDMNGPGHADHVAIYLGNGMAVHGGWMGSSVAIAKAVTVQGAPEHVYRVQ